MKSLVLQVFYSEPKNWENENISDGATWKMKETPNKLLKFFEAWGNWSSNGMKFLLKLQILTRTWR